MRALLFVTLLLATEVASEELLPFVSIHIVTQLKENGVLGSEINVIDFACVDGHCWMDTIVLNRCIFGTQYPISFHLTSGETVNDTLRVTLNNGSLRVEENNRIDTKAIYKFQLAKNRSSGTAIRSKHVTGFYGYYVKELRNKTTAMVEYVRLTDYPIRIELACPIEFGP